mmetsp:Transcript_19665/g.21959  ORF Transcript_19665/g.21959 Transcript_19665/m.21959 type:complete len:432 (+) Transcript_19665:23-1318(+)
MFSKRTKNLVQPGSQLSVQQQQQQHVNLYLIAVVSGLVRTIDVHADVGSLLLRKRRELAAQLVEVEAGDLLVEVLRENVHLVVVLLRGLLVPELELSHHLVGERARHDETRVASGATEVEQTAFGKDNDGVALGEHILVHLGLDVDALDTLVSLQAGHVNLVVKVADVADNGVVLHANHLVHHENALVSGGSDHNVNLSDHVIEARNLVTLHAGLQGADRVHLSDEGAGASRLHGLGATLANITVANHHDALTSEHDIGGAHDSVGEGVTATVHVVELGLGDRVVDVDGGEQQVAGLGHLVQTVHAGGGLLGHAVDRSGNLGPLVGVLLHGSVQQLQDDLELGVVSRRGVGQLAAGLEFSLGLDTLMDEQSGVPTIINNEVGSSLLIRPREGLVGAPPVLLKALSFPGKDVGHALFHNRSGGVVLGGEDVA